MVTVSPTVCATTHDASAHNNVDARDCAFRPMTMTRARQLLAVQAGFGGYYNRNAARLILAEVAREHGPAAADALIAELALDRVFGLAPGAWSTGTR
jgi:hypothetical protein